MNIILILLFTILIAVTRLAPHPPNFTPLLSISIFCGLIFKNKLSFCIPLFAMIISDLWLGFHNVLFFVYMPLLIVFAIGYKFKSALNFKNIAILSLSSSIIFFIVSNFGVWIVGYPKTISGFIACYVAAIPFFHNTLISTLMYSSIFLFVVGYLTNNNLAVYKKNK